MYLKNLNLKSLFCLSLKGYETKCPTDVLKEFQSVEIENRRQKTEVDDIRAEIQLVDKQNWDSRENILKELDDLKDVLEISAKHLQSNHLLMANNQYLHEQITKLKEEIKERDEIIQKLRKEIKEFENLHQDILNENRQTRYDFTIKLQECSVDLKSMRSEYMSMKSVLADLLTESKTKNNINSDTIINIHQKGGILQLKN